MVPSYQLSGIYLVGTGMTPAAWNMLGIGIRIGLERGLHRRRRGERKPTFEDELYKRTFWFVVYACYIIYDFQVFQGLDRNGSSDKQHLWSTTRTT